MSTPPIVPNTLAPASQTSKDDALANVKLDDFLKLLITELSNQDPLNPTDNAQILEQLSQIRSIASTTKMNETLDSMRLGQNLASASALIDQQIRALSDDGTEITGRVDRVTIESGVPKLMVGTNSVSLNNLREILAPEAPPPSAEEEDNTPEPTPTKQKGDATNDGKVDYFDTAAVVNAWGKTGSAAGNGDVNGDGVVDIFDINAVSDNFGAGYPAQ